MATPGFIALDTTNDLHERIGQAVATIVIGVVDAQFRNQVYVGIVPLWETASFPCVFVTWGGATEEQDMDFEGNQDKYPVHVLICDRGDLHDQTNRKEYLSWRKTLMDTFRPLEFYEGVPEVWNVEVQPDIVFDPELPAYQHVVTGFMVKSSTWDSRPKL